MPRKKKRKEKLPFWRKIKNPELKHLAEHLGKITDNTSWKELLDVALALTCAGAGWLAAENLGVKDFNVKAGMALSGAIAYRLATSGNLIAGASGTALLGAYGLIDVWNPLYQAGVEFGRRIEALPEEQKLGMFWWFIPTQPGLGYLYEKLFETIT